MAKEIYVPEEPSGIDPTVGAYLINELRRISKAFGDPRNVLIDKTYVAPEKPRDGEIRLADGTKWNPGAGAGYYGYYGGAWAKLG